MSGDALVAAGHFVPLETDRPDDLRECEGEHREVDLGQAHTEEAKHAGEGRGNQAAGGKGEHEGHAQRLHQQAAAIGAEAEIGRMSEGDQAGRAEQQIEADSEQRLDRDLGARNV